jgi:hypothetical protein
MLLATLVNLLLMGCLAAWVFWWRRASRHIETFKQARLEMSELMAQLHTQLAAVQTEITAISSIARGTLPELERATDTATGLRSELASVIAIGEAVAERIEAAARLARMSAAASMAEPIADPMADPMAEPVAKEVAEPEAGEKGPSPRGSPRISPDPETAQPPPGSPAPARKRPKSRSADAGERDDGGKRRLVFRPWPSEAP